MQELAKHEIDLVSGGQGSVTLTVEYANGSPGVGIMDVVSMGYYVNQVWDQEYATIDDATNAAEMIALNLKFLLMTTPMDEVGAAMTPTTSWFGSHLDATNLDGDAWAEVRTTGESSTGEMWTFVDSNNDNLYDRIYAWQ